MFVGVYIIHCAAYISTSPWNNKSTILSVLLSWKSSSILEKSQCSCARLIGPNSFWKQLWSLKCENVNQSDYQALAINTVLFDLWPGDLLYCIVFKASLSDCCVVPTDAWRPLEGFGVMPTPQNVQDAYVHGSLLWKMTEFFLHSIICPLEIICN